MPSLRDSLEQMLYEKLHDTLSQSATTTDFDVDKIREDFPVLNQNVHGKPLVYLDNAATARSRKR